MQVLAQIQSIPHLRKSMQKFLREKIFNNRHMTVGRLRADGVLTLLREFEKQESITQQTFDKEVNFSKQESYHSLSSRDQEIADIAVNKILASIDKPALESHYTKDDRTNSPYKLYCRYHGENRSHNTDQCRELKSPKGYGNGTFFNRNRSPGHSPGRDNTYSSRQAQPFARRDNPLFRDRSRSRDRSPYARNFSKYSRDATRPSQQFGRNSPNPYENRNLPKNPDRTLMNPHATHPHPAITRLRSLATAIDTT